MRLNAKWSKAENAKVPTDRGDWPPSRTATTSKIVAFSLVHGRLPSFEILTTSLWHISMPFGAVHSNT